MNCCTDVKVDYMCFLCIFIELTAEFQPIPWVYPKTKFISASAHTHTQKEKQTHAHRDTETDGCTLRQRNMPTYKNS